VYHGLPQTPLRAGQIISGDHPRTWRSGANGSVLGNHFGLAGGMLHDPTAVGGPQPAFSVATYNIEGLLYQVGDWSLDACLDVVRRIQPGGQPWPDLLGMTELPVCAIDIESCPACGNGRLTECGSHVEAALRLELRREGFEGACYLSRMRADPGMADVLSWICFLDAGCSITEYYACPQHPLSHFHRCT
jgi:hypothetical protein